MALIPQSASMRGHLAMLIFSMIVAGSFSFGSMIANKIDPVAMNAVRFMIAGTVIGVLAAMGPGLKRSYFVAPWRFVLLGVLFSMYFVSMLEGLKTAPPVSTAAVFTLTPVMSGLFGWVLLGQRTTGRMWVALTLGAIGALWVIFRADIGPCWPLTSDGGRRFFSSAVSRMRPLHRSWRNCRGANPHWCSISALWPRWW